MAQRKKVVKGTPVPLESPVIEDSWVSPVMVAAMAGEPVVFDTTLVDYPTQEDDMTDFENEQTPEQEPA